MYWIDVPRPGSLAIASRPRAGDWLEDEVSAWRHAAVDNVISLLEPHEVHELGLEAEEQTCSRAGIAFTSFPIPDRGVPPSASRTRELIAPSVARLTAGNGVLIHCRAGIGRSSLIAACVLVSLGDPPEVAFERIASARGLAVPDTELQAQWVASYATA